MNILQIYSDLDGSLSQMNTTDVLTVKSEDGTIFEPDMSSFTFSSNVSCQEGQVEEELLCGNTCTLVKGVHSQFQNK